MTSNSFFSSSDRRGKYLAQGIDRVDVGDDGVVARTFQPLVDESVHRHLGG